MFEDSREGMLSAEVRRGRLLLEGANLSSSGFEPVKEGLVAGAVQSLQSWRLLQSIEVSLTS